MEIANIVVGGSFNQPINLTELKKIGANYSYDPNKHHGGYIKLSSATATVYRTGKYIIAGIKAFDLVDTAWKELQYIVSRYLDKSIFTPPLVKNSIAKDDFKINIPLDRIAMELDEGDVEYDPEIFTGLIWKSAYGTMSLFQNGKFILLGCKSEKELEEFCKYGHKKITAILDRFSLSKNE